MNMMHHPKREITSNPKLKVHTSSMEKNCFPQNLTTLLLCVVMMHPLNMVAVFQLVALEASLTSRKCS